MQSFYLIEVTQCAHLIDNIIDNISYTVSVVNKNTITHTVWLQKHRQTHGNGQDIQHLTPLPNNASMLKRLAKIAKKLQHSSLTQKYRAEQFQYEYCVSGDLLYRKMCQRDADWKRVNMCRDTYDLKPLVKNIVWYMSYFVCLLQLLEQICLHH